MNMLKIDVTTNLLPEGRRRLALTWQNRARYTSVYYDAVRVLPQSSKEETVALALLSEPFQ